MTSVDTAPDLHGDDSYRVATDTVIPDDNLTVSFMLLHNSITSQSGRETYELNGIKPS